MQGFYVSGVSGSNADRELSIIANNLANANTVGYRANRASFSTYMSQAQGSAATAYSGFGKQYVDLHTGSFVHTGNTLDFGIHGNGYFRIRTQDGSEAYTRAGNFQMDDQGRLTTADGKLVLGPGGQSITLPKGQVSVSEDGTISVKVAGQSSSKNAGQIGLVQIIDPRKIKKEAGVLLTTPEANVKPANPDVKIMQGFTESSNVNSVQEMTRMMTVQRNFESTMKIVDQYSQQMALLNEQVGQVKG